MSFYSAAKNFDTVKFVCEEIVYHHDTYYSVKPEGWTMMIDKLPWDAMMEYCIATFGTSQGIWVAGERWYVNSARFYFKHESDRTMFLLRWA
jgi:hypothetical protein